jgi:colanic acid/amylovoran biosynthesis glycosyltransferase
MQTTATSREGTGRWCEDKERPVVAHVNYLFFHSTQSFIYFYLSHFRRTQPICLTRAPESPEIKSEIPPPLAEHFYLHGSAWRRSQIDRLLWSFGLQLRRLLVRSSSGFAEPLLGQLQRWVVPWVRSDTDPTRYLAWAEGILRKRRALLIHAYFGPVGWRLLALKRKLGLPLVVTFLGDEIAPNLASWWWWWVQSGGKAPNWPERLIELLAEGDLFLVEGPYLRQRLIDFGCAPEKVQVQRIAIPVRQMPFHRMRKRPDEKAVILFAGRFCEQKGVLYALQAAAELWLTRRDFEFRLIGDEKLTDGQYAARIYATIRDYDIQDCVRLLGFLNHGDYLREMQRSDIFLHPSIVDDNGLSEGGAPTTILEAQALGIPVVSTYHCDIPNVTVPGESAFLVPEKDGKALAQALRTLLDQRDRWEAMGRTGRLHMERYHDIEHEVDTLEDRYLALLCRSREAAEVVR